MLLNEISTQQLVKEAEEVAKELAKRGAFGREGNTKLTTQLRKIYDYLLKIKREVEKGSSDEKIKEKLYLIRPKIAYAVSRSKERKALGLKPLQEKMEPWIHEFREPKRDLEKLIQFMESVISFYKYETSK
ncbi:MAG: type III-A CRISPR-associated protein Csm2 [Candidatus Cloacimonas sp. 4484_209]|nr:MAG: type III-A CRISPR-associated protein Csm2 [Candidatus Cloacimonas sp. 4484_209]RLF26346.1 MAG: type III-A CRISPR-associated protein Csm2 [Thermoplasmata archaeon]